MVDQINPFWLHEYSRFFESMLDFHDSDHTLRSFEFMSLDHVEPTDDIFEPVPALWIDRLRHCGLGNPYLVALLLEMKSSEEWQVCHRPRSCIF